MAPPMPGGPADGWQGINGRVPRRATDFKNTALHKVMMCQVSGFCATT
ncbi:Uncharacterised protein [Halioglobus japonicus]|nr:Uncharacterised protein [Halioglobus japonicus]